VIVLREVWSKIRRQTIYWLPTVDRVLTGSQLLAVDRLLVEALTGFDVVDP